MSSINLVTKLNLCLYDSDDTYLLFIYHNVAVDKNVIKEEELPGFWFLPTHLCEYTLPDQNPVRHCQRLQRWQK